MNCKVLDILQCPNCGSKSFSFNVFEGAPEDIREGVVWCDRLDWFPVERRVLEFLPRDLEYRSERIQFQDKYADQLSACGLLARAEPENARSTDALDPIQAQQRHFDWYAENDQQAYNSYAAMPFWRIVDLRTFATWNRRIQPNLEAGEAPRLLLDVGCAQGRSSLGIAQRGIRVIGFDISKRLAEQAYLNFEKLPGGPEFNDFIVADGSHFPFQPGVFDYVLVYGVLHHLPDPRVACKEIARVLKSGGVYFGSENNRTVLRVIFDLLQRMAPAWHEEAGAQPLIGRRDFADWFAGSEVNLAISYTVFVPPHLVNMLGRNIGAGLVAASDYVLKALPVVREQAGLIVIEGQKN